MRSTKSHSTATRFLRLTAADPTIVSALERCSTRRDVRELLNRRGPQQVGAAWSELDSLTKASLLLTKEFDGNVIHD